MSKRGRIKDNRNKGIISPFQAHEAETAIGNYTAQIKSTQEKQTRELNLRQLSEKKKRLIILLREYEIRDPTWREHVGGPHEHTIYYQRKSNELFKKLS
ncbi:MAG: hypothetical protein ABH803_03445 [Candidatus Micrarchaeota archaeon]